MDEPPVHKLSEFAEVGALDVYLQVVEPSISAVVKNKPRRESIKIMLLKEMSKECTLEWFLQVE